MLYIIYFIGFICGVLTHRYYNNHADDTPAFLARSLDLDGFINAYLTAQATGVWATK